MSRNGVGTGLFEGGLNILANLANFVLQNRALFKHPGRTFYKKQHFGAKLACFKNVCYSLIKQSL